MFTNPRYFKNVYQSKGKVSNYNHCLKGIICWKYRNKLYLYENVIISNIFISNIFIKLLNTLGVVTNKKIKNFFLFSYFFIMLPKCVKRIAQYNK